MIIFRKECFLKGQYWDEFRVSVELSLQSTWPLSLAAEYCLGQWARSNAPRLGECKLSSALERLSVLPGWNGGTVCLEFEYREFDHLTNDAFTLSPWRVKFEHSHNMNGTRWGERISFRSKNDLSAPEQGSHLHMICVEVLGERIAEDAFDDDVTVGQSLELLFHIVEGSSNYMDEEHIDLRSLHDILDQSICTHTPGYNWCIEAKSRIVVIEKRLEKEASAIGFDGQSAARPRRNLRPRPIGIDDEDWLNVDSSSFPKPVIVLGHGPHEEFEFDEFLARCGVTSVSPGSDPCVALILGDEGYDQSDLEFCLESFAGNQRLVLSQREAKDLLWGLITLDEIPEFKRNQPSLGTFQGESSNGRDSLIDNEAFPEEGMLRAMGYRVGNLGLPRDERRRILERFIVSDLPDIESKEYTASWGSPSSGERMQRMASSLRSFIRNARSRKDADRYAKAISHWTDDLEWLTRTHGHRFPTPLLPL